MDELYEKTETLLKALLSTKTGASKDLMVPALKIQAPKIPKAIVPKTTIKQPTAGKVAKLSLPGLPPPSKKDPVKVAEQLKNPNPKKAQVEVLKVEDNGQWSLEKGTLDPLHGINFIHEHHDLGGVGDLTHIKAVHPEHGIVGETVMEHQADGSLKPSDVNVAPSHRRMGIASAMYAHAEKLTNKKIAPSTAQTKLGAALWTGNKANPQFGATAVVKGEPPEPKFKVGDHVDFSNDPGHSLEVVHSRWNPQSETHQYRLRIHGAPEGKYYGSNQTIKPEDVLIHKK